MPITGALGITVAARTAETLTLRMPLAPNRNHKGTAFAGSLSALATLTGWSALWLALHEADAPAHVVIQDAAIRYLLPVRTDALATVTIAADEVRALLAAWRRRGRARLALRVTIHDTAGRAVATFDGRYVVHRHDLFTEGVVGAG